MYVPAFSEFFLLFCRPQIPESELWYTADGSLETRCKVDVWSAGVLSYQMLFGIRPFGHDESQERLLREDTIVKAQKVELTARPSVSSEAKNFIGRCLTYSQAERLDVLTAAQDLYMPYVNRKP
ncbi:unnamed protein product [Calypogeia fissa]